MTTTTKPYHLMTPAERTALRIAQNRAAEARSERRAEPGTRVEVTANSVSAVCIRRIAARRA